MTAGHLRVLLLLVAFPATAMAQETPTLMVGGESDRGYQMTAPHALIVTANRIVIVERRAPYFHVLSKTGALVQSFGREGAGPGEFAMTPAVVHDSANHRLLAFDIKSGRVTYLTLNDSLTFTRTVPVAAKPFAACLENGTPWVITGGKELVAELKLDAERFVPGRTFGTPTWLHPDAAKPFVRQYAIAPGGLLLCDSRTHAAFVMSPLLGEVHAVSLTNGSSRLQRVLNYIPMKLSAEALRIEMEFPDDGIYDELSGALVTPAGVEAVVARHVLDRARKSETVTYRRVLMLPDGTQRVVGTSSISQPLLLAADGAYCYSEEPVPTLRRYASGRCP